MPDELCAYCGTSTLGRIHTAVDCRERVFQALTKTKAQLDAATDIVKNQRTDLSYMHAQAADYERLLQTQKRVPEKPPMAFHPCACGCIGIMTVLRPGGSVSYECAMCRTPAVPMGPYSATGADGEGEPSHG